MFNVSEQISAATRANLEAQAAVFNALSGKLIQSTEQVAELNSKAIKAGLNDSAAVTAKLLAAKDPQEVLALINTQVQPVAANFFNYSRELANIASSTQAEFVQAAEEQFSQTGRKVAELVEDVTKNAPAGSENVVAFMKSALNNANAGYEQFSKSTKQAAQTIEANVNNAVNQFTQTAEKANGRARSK